MKLVYIAGPYSGGSYLEIDANIGVARVAAAFLAENGIGFICPHLNSAHFQCVTPGVPPDFWYQLGLALLERCDSVLRLPGWQQSSGSLLETAQAIEEEMPIFDWADREKLVDYWMKMEAEASVEEDGDHGGDDESSDEASAGEASEETCCEGE